MFKPFDTNGLKYLADGWECLLFDVHIPYFAVQGGLGGFNVDLNLILELFVGRRRLLSLYYL